MQVLVLILSCDCAAVVLNSLCRLAPAEAQPALAEEEEDAYILPQFTQFEGERGGHTIGIPLPVVIKDLLRHVDVDSVKGQA